MKAEHLALLLIGHDDVQVAILFDEFLTLHHVFYNKLKK